MQANNKLAIAGVALGSATLISTIIAIAAPVATGTLTISGFGGATGDISLFDTDGSKATAAAAFGVLAFLASLGAAVGSGVVLVKPEHKLGKPVTMAGFSATMLFSLIAFAIAASTYKGESALFDVSLSTGFAFMIISCLLSIAGLVVAVKLPVQDNSVPKSQNQAADPVAQV